MNKHTPGPWASEPAISSDFDHIRYITADGKIIASVRHRVEQTQAEALANARLVTEAPALLDALRWALEQIEDSLDPDHQAALAAAWATVGRVEGVPA